MSIDPIALVDAHCHIHDTRFCDSDTTDHHSPRTRSFDALRSVLQRAVDANVTRLVTCACHTADWDALETLLARWPGILASVDHAHASASLTDDCNDNRGDISNSTRIHLTPSFGVHPWWANDAHGDYLAQLRAKLLQHPNASVGEIGLCKSARGQAVATDTQETAFCAQLALATELSRTCVIHCVGRYGRLLELLQTQQVLPRCIVLHSYAGGASLVASFTAIEQQAKGATRVFFSLNAKQLSDTRSNKAAASCCAIPLQSLLLETDAPDQSPQTASGLNEPATVAVAYARAAELRQMSLADLAAAVHANATTAFGAAQ